MTWEERMRMIEEQASSGRAVKAWCREKGIAYTTFADWRRKAKRKAAGSENVPMVKWLEVRAEEAGVASRPSAGGVRIERDGWTVTAETGMDYGLLAETLRAVRQSCC